MKLLLDTCCLLWALQQPRKLTAQARVSLEDPNNSVFVSSLSFWEISLKASLGKLSILGAEPEDFPGFVDGAGWSILPFAPETAASFVRLPSSATHRDPFDRMLIWTAIREGLTLVSRDQALPDYESFGLRLCR